MLSIRFASRFVSTASSRASVFVRSFTISPESWDSPGYVLNSSAGVLIEVEGDTAQIDRFVRELRENPPPLAQIEDIAVAKSGSPTDTRRFVIRESVDEPGQLAPVSPDVSTCAGLPAATVQTP